MCNKKVHANNIITCFSSIDYLMTELDLSNLNESAGQFMYYRNHWKEFRESTAESGRGKLMT